MRWRSPTFASTTTRGTSPSSPEAAGTSMTSAWGISPGIVARRSVIRWGGMPRVYSTAKAWPSLRRPAGRSGLSVNANAGVSGSATFPSASGTRLSSSTTRIGVRSPSSDAPSPGSTMLSSSRAYSA
jgi:hypothetical protein